MENHLPQIVNHNEGQEPAEADRISWMVLFIQWEWLTVNTASRINYMQIHKRTLGSWVSAWLEWVVSNVLETYLFYTQTPLTSVFKVNPCDKGFQHSSEQKGRSLIGWKLCSQLLLCRSLSLARLHVWQHALKATDLRLPFYSLWVWCIRT